MMKKPICIFLAVLLLTVPCFLTAFAESADPQEDQVIDVPEYGFYFLFPEEYRDENLKGSVMWDAEYLDTGILHICPIYYAVSPDRLEDYIYCLQESEELPEDIDPNWLSGYEYCCLFEIFFINDGRKEDELRQSLKINNSWREDNFSWLEELGSDGDTTFFLAQYTELEENREKYQEHMGSFYDEFVSLYEDRDSFRSALTLSEPYWPHLTAAGDMISFETTDLEGNPITSAEIFEGHKVTMVNIWATWCGPCVAELPELGKMAEELEAQNCRIIGLCHDAAEEGKAEEARSILSEAGADYLNIMPPDDVDSIFLFEAFPASYFVGSDGKVLVDPVIGARPEAYEKALAEALELAK